MVLVSAKEIKKKLKRNTEVSTKEGLLFTYII